MGSALYSHALKLLEGARSESITASILGLMKSEEIMDNSHKLSFSEIRKLIQAHSGLAGAAVTTPHEGRNPRIESLKAIHIV